jgi:TRAP-type C4-dicarboxylate transport system permease small subunit
VYAHVGGLRILPISGVNMRYVYVAIPLSGALIAFYSLRHSVDVIAAYLNRT